MKYYFDIWLSGKVFFDKQGTDLANVDSVQAEAVNSANELAYEFPILFSSGDDMIEIVDGTGRRVFTLPIYRQISLGMKDCKFTSVSNPE